MQFLTKEQQKKVLTHVVTCLRDYIDSAEESISSTCRIIDKYVEHAVNITLPPAEAELGYATLYTYLIDHYREHQLAREFYTGFTDIDHYVWLDMTDTHRTMIRLQRLGSFLLDMEKELAELC